MFEFEHRRFCHDKTHKVHDIRNGILLDAKLHGYFENSYCTIRKTDKIFKFEIGQSKTPLDPRLTGLDGKTIDFGPDETIWPHESFIKFHNRRFEYAQKKAAVDKFLGPHELDTSLTQKWIQELSHENSET